jgi:hypothetical protein
MNETDILIKTESGIDEVRSRARKLPPRLRSVLILVDGVMRVSQLRKAAATLGAPPDCLDLLLQQGLVAEVAAVPAVAPPAPAPKPAVAPVPARNELPMAPESDTERFRAAQKFMNDIAVDLLGFKAFFFTLKLEKCFSRDDLLQLLPEFTKAIAKSSGEEVARTLQTRARELLQ